MKRCSLSESQVKQIVRAETTERRAAARDYEQAGRADRADQLRREASILESVIDTGQCGKL